MLKGFHILDGYKRLYTNWEYPIQAKDFKGINDRFDRIYKTDENMRRHQGYEKRFGIKEIAAIVFGDYRKFDPDYDPDELFKSIAQEAQDTYLAKRLIYRGY